MISPAWHIRDCVEADMDLVRFLFAEEGMDTLTETEGIRIAATEENTILGALRCEQGSDGIWYVRPVVVFEQVRHGGVGSALIEDALKVHSDLRLVSRGSAREFYLHNGFVECGWEDIAPEWREECDGCPGRDICSPKCFRSLPVEHKLTFLGTSSGCGVPAFFCHCRSCEAARKDASLRRGCTGVVVRGHATVLIDTPPDLRSQLVRENVDYIDEVFLTHAHFDHMGGFGELEYLIRLYMKHALPFHASPYALQECFKEFSYMDDCFDMDEFEEFGTREVDGLTIQALPVVHAPGTYGYLITTPAGTRTFYAPDTTTLTPDVAEIVRGVDNLIWDSTFWGDAGNFKTHHSIQQSIAEGIELEAGTIYLTHLAPHLCEPEVDVIAEVNEYVKGFDGRVVVAYDGLEITL